MLLDHGVHLVRHRQFHPEEHLAPHWEQLLGREIVVVEDVQRMSPPGNMRSKYKSQRGNDVEMISPPGNEYLEFNFGFALPFVDSDFSHNVTRLLCIFFHI